MYPSAGTSLLIEFILTNQSKLTSKSPVTKFYPSFLFNFSAHFRLEPNMAYLSENKKGLVRTLLLDLDKHFYLMLQAKYKDKLNTSTEYYPL